MRPNAVKTRVSPQRSSLRVLLLRLDASAVAGRQRCDRSKGRARAIATESGMSAVFAGAVSVTEEGNVSKSIAECGAPAHRLMFTRPATTTLRKVQ